MRLPPPLLVALGGATGAALRWAIITQGLGVWEKLPLTVLFINMVGCLLLGILLGLGVSERPKLLLGVGFCGGLTTFATFAVDVASLLQDQLLSQAGCLLAVSIVSGLLAFIVGRRFGKALT